jgi:hypothetical protein
LLRKTDEQHAISGGYLSQPSKKYPSLFSTKGNGPLALYGLWEKYPYFLPCAVSATMTWFSILLGAFYLEETLASKVQIKTRASEAKKKVSEQTSLLTSANQPTAYDSTSSTERNTDSNGTQPSENTAPHHHPTQSASHERPPFSRPLRKRSRRSLAPIVVIQALQPHHRGGNKDQPLRQVSNARTCMTRRPLMTMREKKRTRVSLGCSRLLISEGSC